MAVLATEDVGLFVNTGGFTRDAEDEASSQQVRWITLIDLEKLVDIWAQHYSKLEQSAKRRMPLEPIWFLAPEA
jgi:restriction system protein